MVPEYRFAALEVGGTGKGLRQRLQDAGLKDWRIDIAHIGKKLAIEVEGGIWNGGRHTRGAGFDEDCRKYNVLQLLGWRVLRFTGTSIKSGVALATIEAALKIEWKQTWEVVA